MATTEVMTRVSLLMGCDDVSTLVLQRTMKVPGAVYNIQLTPLQAQAARNAFGKAVYCLLFDWVVAKVNDSIRGAASDEPTARASLTASASASPQASVCSTSAHGCTVNM